MSVTYDEMAVAQLKWIDKPLTNNNVQSMVVWAVSESSQAHWNIWDTTEDYPGATDYNSAGVKNYPDIDAGLNAFKATINNGRYPMILQCLSESAPPAVTCNAIANTPWGSKPSPELVGEVLTNWTTYASVIVSGSEDEPVDPTIYTPPPVTPIPTPVPVPNLIEGDAMITSFKDSQTNQIHTYVYNPESKKVTHWWQDTVGTDTAVNGPVELPGEAS